MTISHQVIMPLITVNKPSDEVVMLLLNTHFSGSSGLRGSDLHRVDCWCVWASC